ncbi:anhydro-N-acetylmuramic acid kinase [Candidatus Pelagibacter communis]|uniref:anhydro-N-acetylmuramic acid kinase n=1 Tax=Pelagibacter ubique TaxID=198252 RepID=UPI00094CDB73|nr:anhydro-N-acetylmuramic acid kinase [Candidatus Pelagibacter ubique]
MLKNYYSLGLMSGTSGDGVDASLINTDGETNYNVEINKYFEYENNFSQKLHSLKDKINTVVDLETYSREIKALERELTIFHSKVVIDIIENTKSKIDFVGFHGQTIFHNPSKKISKQIGDGKLLSQLTQTTVVYNFRQNDIQNNGEGAPLAPIFHKALVKQNKIELPVCILNIGGISNVTVIGDYEKNDFTSRDLGPGNCLIDAWVRKSKKGNFDKDGAYAAMGKTNDLMLNQALDNFDNRPDQNRLSFDTKDFDINFLRGVSFEDGAATLTDLSGRIIGAGLASLLSDTRNKLLKVLVSGGGRKNKTLIQKIKSRTLKNLVIQLIDDYGVDGDYVESQAFAYLAIRRYLKLPISFPNTTGCKKPLIGGEIVKNY